MYRNLGANVEGGGKVNYEFEDDDGFAKSAWEVGRLPVDFDRWVRNVGIPIAKTEQLEAPSHDDNQFLKACGIAPL